MKFLLVLIVVAVAVWIWRQKQQRMEQEVRRAAPPRTPPLPQPMLRCAWCGVHVPQTDAVLRDGRAYCCTEHARAGAEAPGAGFWPLDAAQPGRGAGATGDRAER